MRLSLDFLSSKCPFYKKCKLYQVGHSTCNKDGGSFYGPGRGGGCYREMEASA